MDFLTWHFSDGLRFYASRYVYSVRSVIHYFSLTVLLTSLFAPWKRLSVRERAPGFNINTYFTNLSFNLVSRFIGAIVRIVLFIAGIIVLVLLALFGAIGFVVWSVFPLFSVGVYMRYVNNPRFIASTLWKRMKNGKPIEELVKSAPGQFLITHTGISSESFISSAKPVKISGGVESFEDIVSFLVKEEVWDNIYLRRQKADTHALILAARWWDQKMANNSIDLVSSGYDSGGIGRELLFGYTPLLGQYATDMSISSFSHHLIGRAEIVSRMERMLTGGKSVILSGKPGVGKKTVVYEFAHRARRGEFGTELAYRRVLELDYNFVFSASQDKNKKKKLLADIFDEAAAAGNIILVLRDLHRITNDVVEGLDITDILETHLTSGKLKIITISSDEDYEKYLARSLKLKKFFETVVVTEPTKKEALEILLEAAETWEKTKKIIITTPALLEILDGSDEYITDTPFPEKALELLDAVVFLEEQGGLDKIITIDDANAALSEKTGIPSANITKSDSEKLANLEEIIHERLVNQESAVNLIAKILRSKTLGITKSSRPIGSFLFLGPTGVGKTETAKVLAKVYFGSTDKIIRFDMAEYVGREGLERLIGSVEKNSPGALSVEIKNHPASLLLLDEIEKAPPEVFNIFLAMLDEGSITDAFGKKVNCKNLFIIATSNAGGQFIREAVGRADVNLQQEVVDHVLKMNIFTPEFVNRFDGVVVYEPLTREHLVKVARLLLLDLSANMESKNIAVNFSDEAVEKLAEDGFEPEFGARPMRRIIELSIGDLLGKALLSGQIAAGDSVTVTSAEAKGEFSFTKNQLV